jgi:hypothetical protein
MAFMPSRQTLADLRPRDSKALFSWKRGSPFLMSGIGPTRTFRNVRYPVAIGGKADNICSF